MATPENLRPAWQPGQSGNPGGKTSEQRKLEVANAEKATRIRSVLLNRLVALADEYDGNTDHPEALAITHELLKLIKDSEDRGLGAPTNKTALTDGEGNALAGKFTVEFTSPGPGKGEADL